MNQNELRIISDTGEESNFQVTSLYSEQFMEVFNTIQINRNDCLRDIEEKHEYIKDRLDEYNLKIIDILYFNEIDLREKLDVLEISFDQKLKDQEHKLTTVWYDRFTSIEDEAKMLDSKVNKFKDIQENIDSLIFDDLTAIQVNIAGIDEKIESLRLKDVEILNVIRSLRDELKQEIEELKSNKQDVKKPWYKRIFSK